jgi:hypothetical protein
METNDFFNWQLLSLWVPPIIALIFFVGQLEYGMIASVIPNDKMKYCISQLRLNMMDNRGAQLSYRMKGRILSAVVKHEKVIDLRRAFLCWHTRTNDELIR